MEGLGSLKWIVGPRDIPGRMEGDPPWFTTYESISGRREVEVVLVQGAWECVPEQVWSSKSVRVILRVSSFVSNCEISQRKGCRSWNKTRKIKRFRTIPNGWTARMMLLSHEELGGVTKIGRAHV